MTLRTLHLFFRRFIAFIDFSPSAALQSLSLNSLLCSSTTFASLPAITPAFCAFSAAACVSETVARTDTPQPRISVRLNASTAYAHAAAISTATITYSIMTAPCRAVRIPFTDRIPFPARSFVRPFFNYSAPSR